MSILKNPEVKKLYALLAVLIVLFSCLAILINQLGINLLKNSIENSISAIVGAIAEKYPELEADVILQLQKSEPGLILAGKAILSKYGYHSNNLMLESEQLTRYYFSNIIMSVSFAVLICIILILVFSHFIKMQYSRINDVTEYARLIQAQDYTLDIRDNAEGDISMLKNEIYKITTMLREQAETLQKDKIGLSNSIADISHQLKTPMTSLFVLSDILSNDPDPETRQVFIQKIQSQLERMEWLISSLLKLSRLDAGTIAMKKERISMSLLVDKALEPLIIPIKRKSQRVLIDFANDENSGGIQYSYLDDDSITGIKENDIQFIGDFNWTREALVNILKNCMEHTPEDGQILISCEDNPIYTSITISDNGHGIDSEDLPYIFNRFYKGRNAGDDSVGIGLAMAKAIVSAQNGDITVKSEKEKGTTFQIKFYKVL